MTDEKQAVKVLVVDDDEMLCDVVAVFLSENGFEVIKANDGTDGLQQFRSESPDLVLLDIRMPGMSGTEVLTQLTSESPQTPVIMVSATSDLGDVVEVLRLGAWDYVIKPISDMEFLLHAIDRALDRAKILQENQQYKEHLEEEVLKRTTELAEVNAAMERKNIALEELISSVQSQQSQVGQAIVKNVETIIGPELQSLRDGLPYDKQRVLDKLSEHLHEITSPFVASLSQEFAATTSMSTHKLVSFC